MDEPHLRLQDARKKAGYRSGSAAAEALGVATPTYLAHENGSRAFNMEQAKKYARKFNVAWTWLVAGEGSPARLAVERHRTGMAVLQSELRALKEESSDIPHLGTPPEASKVDGTNSDRFLEISARPLVESNVENPETGERPSGESKLRHELVGEWHLPTSYFRDVLRIDPASIFIIEVKGDAMSPTFVASDRAIIDGSCLSVEEDGVYAIDAGEGEIVVRRIRKRLFAKPASFDIIADNALSNDQTVPASEIRVVGKVVGRIGKI